MQLEDVISKLKKYNNLKVEIKKLKIKVDVLAEDITELPALACSEKIQSSNTRKVVEDNTLKLIQDKKIIEHRIRNKEYELSIIDTGLSELGYYERKVLEMRYINKCSWRECEEELGYSERYLQKIRIKALKELKVFLEV